MFYWMKKILGFAAKDEQPPGASFDSHTGTGSGELAANAELANSERVPLSDAELGALLLQRLAQDPSMSELSLAVMTGRNISHVRKLLAAARERQGSTVPAQSSPSRTDSAVSGSQEVPHLVQPNLAVAFHVRESDAPTSCESVRPPPDDGHTSAGAEESAQGGCTTAAGPSGSADGKGRVMEEDCTYSSLSAHWTAEQHAFADRMFERAAREIEEDIASGAIAPGVFGCDALMLGAGRPGGYGGSHDISVIEEGAKLFPPATIVRGAWVGYQRACMVINQRIEEWLLARETTG